MSRAAAAIAAFGLLFCLGVTTLTAYGPAQDRKVIRAGGSVVPRKIHDVPAVYPEEAKAGVAGIVILDAHIDIEGNVVDTAVLKSIPLLDQAAQEAVLQWKYAPMLLNGEPVDVILTVSINFALNQ
jgi:protein TonB